uniref:Putative secreted peptide n=1 Tax=Anopheles braziliensis TaxID=58242 RepID=A0A2M3ZW40_9DIPT
MRLRLMLLLFLWPASFATIRVGKRCHSDTGHGMMMVMMITDRRPRCGRTVVIDEHEFASSIAVANRIRTHDRTGGR